MKASTFFSSTLFTLAIIANILNAQVLNLEIGDTFSTVLKLPTHEHSITPKVERTDSLSFIETIDQDWKAETNQIEMLLQAFGPGKGELVFVLKEETEKHSILAKIEVDVADDPTVQSEDALIPNKGPIKIERTQKRSRFWWLILTLPLGILFWVWWQGRQNHARNEPDLDPSEKALLALETLRMQEDESDFSSEQANLLLRELAQILRAYLGASFYFPAEQSSSQEILAEEEIQNLSAPDQKEIQEILNAADTVKFAKGQSAFEFTREKWETLYQFILKAKERQKEDA